MGVLSRIQGTTRRAGQLARYAMGAEDRSIEVNDQGELLVAWGSQQYVESVRHGHAFRVSCAAVASVTAVPTTATALLIWNNEPDGGRSFIIDRVTALFTANTAALPHAGIIANLGQQRAAAQVASGGVIYKQNGLNGALAGNVDSKAIVVAGGTLDAITGVAIGWFPLGDSINAAVTSLPGFQKSVEIGGRLIVPPGRSFGVHTLASVTSCSAVCGVEWTEAYLDLA